MKNLHILLILAGIMVYSHITKAQDDGMDFIEEFVVNEEATVKGRNKAENLLNEQPKILKLRENEEKLLLEGQQKRDELARKINEKKYLDAKKKEAMSDITKRLQPAPFGLYWNATKEELENIGIVFTPDKRENYEGVYRVENPKQKYTAFNPVFAIFGLQNHLMCVYAIGTPQPDKPNAERILQTYHQYYNALEKKYGNGQEFFTPYTYIEEKVEKKDEKKKITQIKHQNPLGNENFLEELQTGKASLYATFENENTGVILNVFASEKQESFITIDYKNLNIMNKEKEKNIDNLMDDL